MSDSDMICLSFTLEIRKYGIQLKKILFQSEHENGKKFYPLWKCTESNQDVEHSELAWLVVWGDHCSDCIMVNVVNGPFIPSDAPKFLTVHSTGSVLTLLSLSATPVCVHPGPGPPACVRTGEEGGVPRGGGKPHSCHQVVQERLRSERGHHSGIRTFLCREIKEKIWIFL